MAAVGIFLRRCRLASQTIVPRRGLLGRRTLSSASGTEWEKNEKNGEAKNSFRPELFAPINLDWPYPINKGAVQEVYWSTQRGSAFHQLLSSLHATGYTPEELKKSLALFPEMLKNRQVETGKLKDTMTTLEVMRNFPTDDFTQHIGLIILHSAFPSDQPIEDLISAAANVFYHHPKILPIQENGIRLLGLVASWKGDPLVLFKERPFSQSIISALLSFRASTSLQLPAFRLLERLYSLDSVRRGLVPSVLNQQSSAFVEHLLATFDGSLGDDVSHAALRVLYELMTSSFFAYQDRENKSQKDIWVAFGKLVAQSPNSVEKLTTYMWAHPQTPDVQRMGYRLIYYLLFFDDSVRERALHQRAPFLMWDSLRLHHPNDAAVMQAALGAISFLRPPFGNEEARELWLSSFPENWVLLLSKDKHLITQALPLVALIRIVEAKLYKDIDSLGDLQREHAIVILLYSLSSLKPPESMNAQLDAIKCLMKLCRDDRAAEQVVIKKQNGGLTTICNVMRKFPSFKPLVGYGFFFLAEFFKTGSPSLVENCMEIYKAGGVNLAVSAFHRFHEDIIMKATAFDLLFSLATYVPEALDEVNRALGVNQILISLASPQPLTNENRELKFHALFVSEVFEMLIMLEKNKKIGHKELFLNIDLVCQRMQNYYENLEIQILGSHLLSFIVDDTQLVLGNATKREIRRLLNSAMKNFPTSDAVCQISERILATLSKKVSSNS